MASETLRPMGVYVIRNSDTGRVYVGSTNNLKTRWNTHRNHAKKGVHHSYRFQSEWDASDGASFTYEVLEEVLFDHKLIEREQFWIDHFHSAEVDCGLNISPTAGGIRGLIRTAETRARIAAAKLGTKKAPEEIERRSANRRGKHHSEATIALMCATRSGKSQPSKRGLNFEIAEEIRRLRREERIPQHKLAERFGCSRKSVREIISWNTYLTPD